MQVKYTGLKRKAPANLRGGCTLDVFTQEELLDDDHVAILKDGNMVRCYKLEPLATWFLEQTISFGRLPSLPDNRAAVPHTVYKEVVDGTLRAVGCERIIQKVSGVPSAAGREFALTGQRNVNRTRTRRDSQVLSAIEELRRQMPAPSPPRLRRQNAASITDDDVDDLLSELLGAAESEVIDMDELRRTLPLPLNVLEALENEDSDVLISVLNGDEM